jgi:hypothetical protein
VTINLDEERRTRRPAQSPGDERERAGGQAGGAVTSGGFWGTSGAGRLPVLAYVALVLFLLALATVNALSQLHDFHRLQKPLAAWAPFVWEYSSMGVTLALLPVVAWLLKLAPPRRGQWLRFALVHGPGTVAYSLVHVGGFVLVRKLIYWALGLAYQFSATDLLYEYRKDLLSYVLFMAFFALAPRLFRERTPAAPAAGAGEATFDIRDGARLIRARTHDIVMASAAGNYVEFHLVDGRRLLMRTTLAKAEAALAPHGFVRTHRSWLVNAACVRTLAAEGGSGDFRLELDGGCEAPLSRRFPQALGRLRQPA